MKSLIRKKSKPKEIRNSLMFCSIQKQFQVMTLFLRDFKAWGIKIKVATITDCGDEKVTPKINIVLHTEEDRDSKEKGEQCSTRCCRKTGLKRLL